MTFIELFFHQKWNYIQDLNLSWWMVIKFFIKKKK